MSQISNEYKENSKGKTANESEVQMTELILPNHTNLLGNLLGGKLMHWIDIAGAMAASRHSNKVVATVALDSLDFRHPVRLGEVVMLNARLTWVGRTSMEVCVKVYAENIKTGSTMLTNRAFITFVALDDDGNPSEVPPLILKTEQEGIIYKEAEKRRKYRLKIKDKE
ncbi:acyl-CoA thioesterase [Herbivorax sp. ANBcel31]|uniref:acyl-CoA thioesterase n=1 Tax=Herbivorax sp. ANBcel31 TaxID=3069754 RepID=UPI0027B0F296|nr:acyl-CoA thioesterase [Herbivorax sp. ANBcel31]MDQ2086344.1 acyl-CoA thioesterase [Herbivorax sp. ANBcel31]